MRKEETRMQAECTQWFWNTYPDLRRLLHCNMNNSASRNAGALAKAVGVVSGVSDLEFVWYKVYFIELKTETGVQSQEQKDFERKVEKLGHVYLLIRSVEEFKTTICNLIGR